MKRDHVLSNKPIELSYAAFNETFGCLSKKISHRSLSTISFGMS